MFQHCEIVPLTSVCPAINKLISLSMDVFP